MASSGNARAAIKVFSSALSAFGVTPPSLEMFRQAKFGSVDPRVTTRFWRMLHDLCVVAHDDFPPLKEEDPYPQSSWPDDEAEQQQSVSYIVKYVESLGYGCGPFLSSSLEMCSSRELLIAVGYLVGYHKLFDKYEDLLRKKMQEMSLQDRHARASGRPSSDTQHPCPPYALEPSEDHDIMEKARAVADDKIKASYPPPNISLSTSQATDALMIAASRIEACQKALRSSVESRANLSYQLCMLQGTHMPLSLYEIRMTMDPKLLSEHIQATESSEVVDTATMESFRSHQCVFWEWMDSVVSERPRYDDIGQSASGVHLSPQVDEGALEDVQDALGGALEGRREELFALQEKWFDLLDGLDEDEHRELLSDLQEDAEKIRSEMPNAVNNGDTERAIGKPREGTASVLSRMAPSRDPESSTAVDALAERFALEDQCLDDAKQLWQMGKEVLSQLRSDVHTVPKPT